jgi:hypothetical protein
MGLLGKILGSDEIIKGGMNLIDDMFETDAEKRESKTKAKIDLMKAYAPFKVAQRYLALMFGGSFLMCFWIAVFMALTGRGSIDDLMKVMDAFMIAWIMTSIIIFYFGGGLVESGGNAVRKGKGKHPQD